MANDRDIIKWVKTNDSQSLRAYYEKNPNKINDFISFGDTTKATAFFLACECNKVGVIKTLLDLGADPNKPSKTGCPPLFIATVCGKEEAFFYLVEEHKKNAANFELDLTVKRRFDKANLLHAACGKKGSANIAKWLIANQPNLIDETCVLQNTGVTGDALNIAKGNEHQDTAKLLATKITAFDKEQAPFVYIHRINRPILTNTELKDDEKIKQAVKSCLAIRNHERRLQLIVAGKKSKSPSPLLNKIEPAVKLISELQKLSSSKGTDLINFLIDNPTLAETFLMSKNGDSTPETIPEQRYLDYRFKIDTVKPIVELFTSYVADTKAHHKKRAMSLIENVLTNCTDKDSLIEKLNIAEKAVNTERTGHVQQGLKCIIKTKDMRNMHTLWQEPAKNVLTGSHYADFLDKALKQLKGESIARSQSSIELKLF